MYLYIVKRHRQYVLASVVCLVCFHNNVGWDSEDFVSVFVIESSDGARDSASIFECSTC